MQKLEYTPGSECKYCGATYFREEFILLHKKMEERISKLEQPVLGLKGGINREQVLQIIEEEFGKLMDNVR